MSVEVDIWGTLAPIHNFKLVFNPHLGKEMDKYL